MKQSIIKRILLTGLAAVGLIGLLAGCSSSGGSAGESTPPATAPAAGTDAPADANAVAVTEWEIPMLTAATGAIAYVGKPAGWAAEYAAEIINANGGIRGVPVKVTVLDTAFDTSKAVTQMTSVVDNALVVLGPMDAPGAESAGQVAYDGGVPNILIRMPQISESSVGYLIYFFEYVCGLSGYLPGVNPFDQPGVEAYKKNMFALLGKPGYEEMKQKLESRL